MEVVQKKILLIDDELDLLEILSALLLKENFQVDMALGAEVGLEKLSENHYDIVVCDFVMPKIDGIKLLTMVREMKSFVPFIFFSGNAVESHEIKMVNLGAYQLLPKTDIMKLPVILKNILKHNEEIKAMNKDGNQMSIDFLNILHSTEK